MAKLKSKTTRHAPPPVVADRVVAVLAGVGLLVALYLTVTKIIASHALFCASGGGCDIVQSSRWSTFFGAPTAAWGAVVYAAIVALALAGFTAGRWLFTFLLTAAAAGFSAYLTWIELFVLHAVCPYCLVVAIISVALIVVLLLRRPATAARRPWAQPLRLAGFAVTTAVVAIVITAAAFQADTGLMQSTGQEALARHLASSGAIFYGAYW
jgi:uncharacterized membrane protein